MSEIKYSDSIKAFIDSLKGVVPEYEYCYDRVNELDKLQQDYLHKLEFEVKNAKEGAKVATQLRKLRAERRKCKNRAEVLFPLYTFLTESKGKNVINMLYEVVNKIKQAETRQENRTYTNRVLKDEVSSDGK